MNILYTNFHRGSGGGHDTYITSLVARSPHNVFVACPPTSSLYRTLEQQRFSNLFPLSFPGKLKELPAVIRNVRALSRLIDGYEIDIVHTNGSPDNRLALYARMLCTRKFRTLLTKHNSFPVSGRVSRWRFLRANDAVILVSHSVTQTLGFPVSAPGVHVIRNGVDTRWWQPPDETDASLSDRLRLVSIAGTAPYKGWHYLLRALALLPPAVQARFSVTIAGHMPPAERLRRLCGGLPVEVSFTGFLSDPRPLLAKSDIGFVLSDAVETISFACREMMAAGLPVIVSDFGGLPENVTPGTDGWIVPAGDERALAALLTCISRMHARDIAEMKRSARRKAVEAFDISQMVGATNQVYASLT